MKQLFYNAYILQYRALTFDYGYVSKFKMVIYLFHLVTGRFISYVKLFILPCTVCHLDAGKVYLKCPRMRRLSFLSVASVIVCYCIVGWFRNVRLLAEIHGNGRDNSTMSVSRAILWTVFVCLIVLYLVWNRDLRESFTLVFLHFLSSKFPQTFLLQYNLSLFSYELNIQFILDLLVVNIDSLSFQFENFKLLLSYFISVLRRCNKIVFISFIDLK
jgi:hypothetical protein